MKWAYYISFASILFFGCNDKKKVIEIIPVVEFERDLSIDQPEPGDIKFFSFPSSTSGFAASDTNFIFRTVDAGKSWEKIKIENDGGKCAGLEFFTPEIGLVLMGRKLYRTTDGGDVWTETMKRGDFIDLSSDREKAYLMDAGDFYKDILISEDQGQTFQNKASFDEFGDIIHARVSGRNMIAVMDHNAFLMDISSEETTELTTDMPNTTNLHDLYFSEFEFGVMVGDRGGLATNYDEVGLSDETFFSRKHYAHTYTYYSVDGIGDVAVCVGDKTITSNYPHEGLEEDWNEHFDINGNSFNTTFYKIEMISDDQFYVSGSEGFIKMGKL